MNILLSTLLLTGRPGIPPKYQLLERKTECLDNMGI